MNYYGNAPATHVSVWSEEYKLAPPPIGANYRHIEQAPGIQPPSPGVVEAQDASHTEAAFLEDLSRVTQRR